MSFQYLNLVFANSLGDVTAVTQPAASNVLTPTVSGNVGMDSLVFFGTVDVNTSITTAVSASASQVTSSGGSILFTNSSANGYAFGLIVQFTTSTTLPTGISAATDYYVVPVSATTYKVATSYANALVGTYVAYTDTGTGNQTATPTALASASVYLQGSADSTNWVTIPNTTTTITADASIGPIEVDYIRYPNIRAYVTLASGQMAFSPLQIVYRGA